jgi:hypothetical protein
MVDAPWDIGNTVMYSHYSSPWDKYNGCLGTIIDVKEEDSWDGHFYRYFVQWQGINSIALREADPENNGFRPSVLTHLGYKKSQYSPDQSGDTDEDI